MQQKRQQALSSVDAQRGVAAFLLAIVDAQAANAVDIFYDADRSHHAISIAHDMAAVRNIDERETRCAEKDDEPRCSRYGNSHSSPPAWRGECEIARRDEQQRHFWPERGKCQQSEDNGRAGRAERVD